MCNTNAYIGEVSADMTIIAIDGYIGKELQVIVRCSKCSRVKQMRYRNFLKNSGTSHKWCVNQVKYPKHFYRKWVGLRGRTTNKNNKKYYR